MGECCKGLRSARTIGVCFQEVLHSSILSSSGVDRIMRSRHGAVPSHGIQSAAARRSFGVDGRDISNPLRAKVPDELEGSGLEEVGHEPARNDAEMSVDYSHHLLCGASLSTLT